MSCTKRDVAVNIRPEILKNARLGWNTVNQLLPCYFLSLVANKQQGVHQEILVG